MLVDIDEDMVKWTHNDEDYCVSIIDLITVYENATLLAEAVRKARND